MRLQSMLLRSSVFVSLVLLLVGSGCPGWPVRVVSPVAGEVVTRSAVTLEASVAGDVDPGSLRVLLNDRDVTARVAIADRSVTGVFAGLADAENSLRVGANRFELRAERVAPDGTRSEVSRRVAFRWDPALANVRIIAVGHRIEFGTLESFASWEAEVDRIFAEHVEPNLAPGRPNLVVLAEDFGLAAGTIGSRGATTRARPDRTPLAALSGLLAAYGGAWNCYVGGEPRCDFAERVGDAVPFGRGLFLAAADTLVRAFDPVLSERAARYGVHLAASNNLPEFFRETDPERVAFFGDVDDPGRSDVYLPATTEVWNRAYLWGPDGARIGQTEKVFLTPLEESLLELNAGRLEDVEVFDTAVGRIGFAISRDAFIDVYRRRLDALGATLVVQPDANPEHWASDFGWEPEVWLASVFGSISPAYPNLWVNVCPMMVGNFFTGPLAANGTVPGVVFDGQSTITRKSSAPPADPVFVGNAPAASIAIPVDGTRLPLLGSFVAQSPWTWPDPATLADAAALDAQLDACAATPRSAALRGRAPATLSLEERRNVLRDCADSLLPYGANPNAYRESVAVGDVEVPVSR